MTKVAPTFLWLGVFLIPFLASIAHAQSTLLPPECAGKTGNHLDQCVRDLTPPTGNGQFEPLEPKANPRVLLNCNVVHSADQGFCIARNEIILECRKTPKHADFDACVNQLIARPQRPQAADCARSGGNQQSTCDLRNKYLADCLKDPWLYFSCLGEKTYGK